MLVTEKELYSWIKKADVIQIDRRRNYDECGNCWEQRVYKYQDKYYVIAFNNEKPANAWEKGRRVRDQQGNELHEIVEVSRKNRTVEQVYYCDGSGHEVYIEDCND